MAGDSQPHRFKLIRAFALIAIVSYLVIWFLSVLAVIEYRHDANSFELASGHLIIPNYSAIDELRSMLGPDGFQYPGPNGFRIRLADWSEHTGITYLTSHRRYSFLERLGFGPIEHIREESWLTIHYALGWPVAAVLGLVTGMLLTKLAIVVQRRRRARNGQCSQCGYDLRGNTSGKCSECGNTAIPKAVSGMNESL